MADSVRWTQSVSKDTDVTLRTFLARSGLKKGDLSKFVEDAVQWRLIKR
jgi:Ribbon-helix-helix domain